jgi:hypothetical protein
VTENDAHNAGNRNAENTVPGRAVVLYCLAILSAATAVIHFAVAGQHFREYWLYGVFMLAAAWLQLAWAVTAVARPSRALLWAGVVLDAGVAAVYAVTRTAGDLVGPSPHTAEPVGFGDVLCTVIELAVAAGCLWLLIARPERRVRRQRLIVAPVATGAVTATLLSVALVAGGPEMVMSMSGASAAAGSAPVRLATTSPAGPVTMPDPGMQMPGGMKMASSASCDTTPTAAQQQAAVRLVNASWQQARKYQSLAAATAAGYRPVTPAGAPVVHYISRSAYRATLLGGPVLNTAAPQSLVYANTPSGPVLAAAMYITSPGGATPQPGGCLTQWHEHTNLCLRGGLGVVGALNQAHPTCPPGSKNKVTPPMMHIWFVPIPGGPTAIDASSAQIVKAAEQAAAATGGGF